MGILVFGTGLVPRAGLATPAHAARGMPESRTIRLKVAEFDPFRGIPEHAALPRRERYPAGTRGGYLVQFAGPITAQSRQALEEAGASVKGYLPMMTLEVVMTEATRAVVESIPGVRWVGLYQADYKLSPGLLQAHAPPFDPARPIRLQVSLFPGEETPGLIQLRELGADVRRVDRGRSFAVAELEIAAGRLASLAQLPLVRHVEPVYPRKPNNDRARFHSGLSAIADDSFASGLDPALDGLSESTGFQVKYAHLDGGLAAAHPDFQAGLNSGWLSFEPGADTDDTDSGHGTHTAGSIVGDGGAWSSVAEVPPGSGSLSPGRWRGVQPQAALHHTSFENGYSDAQTLARAAQEGAQISSNSWGYCSPRGPLFCDSITEYNTNATIWDEGVWDADGAEIGLQPLIVFFSAGNDGSGASDGCGPSGADQIGSPGTAKNVITVGARETDRGCGPDGDQVGDVAFFSSRGPVDPDATGQGLFKPEVTHVGGLWVLSAEAAGTGGSVFDSPSSCSNTGPHYRYEAGTSMSCPLTAGVGGVVLQDLVVNRGIASPAPSLVKALLINGAQPLQPSGACSYALDTSQAEVHQGWGLVRATDSLYGPGGTPSQRNLEFENEVSDHAVSTGEQYQRTLSVGAGVPLRVTLVWTDFPASPSAGSPLVVNDLDLEVSGPDGVFLGNNLVGNWSVPAGVRAVPDRYNVVENVYLQNAAGGSYTITVRGVQVSQDQEPEKPGVNQDFSLVWSHPALPGCSDSNDNDGDGFTDFPGDPGCDNADDPSETSPLLVCDDGEDNDLDQLADFPADPGCREPTSLFEDPQCDDGLDNDGDHRIDWDGGPQGGEPDPQCVVQPWRNRERAGSCGLGFELALLLPPLLGLHRRRHGGTR